MNDYQLENSRALLKNVHLPNKCVGATCPVHRKTNHKFRNQAQVWAGIMYRKCEHGYLHLDPDEPQEFINRSGITNHPACDGCCEDVDIQKVLDNLFYNTEFANIYWND
jgi:hypothetical protein